MPDPIDENITELKIALQELDGIDLRELGKPPALAGAPLTNEIVAWTVRLYAYTVVCHFRELLRAVLLLVETDHISAAFPCCRALFELTAHSYYVKKHVVQHLKNNDLDSAWLFLSDVYLASREIREGQKAGSFQKLKMKSDYPEGPHIAKVMACFNEYFPDGQKEKSATSTYSALSEFTHPNFFAFISHLDGKADSGDLPTVKFGKPPRRLLKICLPAAVIAVSAFLFTIGDLVRVVRDEELATAMYNAVRAVIKSTEPASS